MGPLQGITVLDFSGWAVGPWSGMLLGALGARVVKVDNPEGDGITFLPPYQKGGSTIYLCLNLYKDNIRLDLKSEEGRQHAYNLLRFADVFIENMPTGTIERLGLGYDVVSEINPRIVYASSAPFGRTGPMAQRAAIDPVLQAFTGSSSIQGSPGGRWEMMRLQGHLDLNTSIHIAMGVLYALVLRQQDGKGRRVDLTMLGSALKMQSNRLAEFFASGQQPPLLGSAAATTAPHRAFLCRDQVWLVVAATSEAQWRRFCLAVRRPDLAEDPRFATNRDRVTHREDLEATLEETFGSKPYRWWESQLARYRVPHGRLLDFALMRVHEEMRRYVPTVTHPTHGTYHVGAVPIHYEQAPIEPPWIRAEPLGTSTEPEHLSKELATKES